MSTKKRLIGFYADPEVQDWYDSLSSGERTKQINSIIKQHLGLEKKKTDKLSTLEKRLKKLESER